jgi:hypothetical protein
MSKDMLKQLIEKIRSIKIKLPNKPNLPQASQSKKLNLNNKMLVGISVGFILGALGSAIILNMRLEKVLKEYNSKKLMLASKLKSCQHLSQNYVQSTPIQTSITSAIEALPSSNIFASFYAKLIEEKEKQQSKQNPQPRHQSASVSAPSPTPPPAPELPPLKSLIGKNTPDNNQPNNSLQWIVPSAPPTPQVSVITCSENNTNCYAVSPDGTVYTNGYKEGNYKLVVTPSQVYWVKIDRRHSEN